MSRAKIDDRL